jgi:hypothetical protein
MINGSPTDVETAAAEINAIADSLYGRHPSRKPSIYLNEYAKWFAPLRNQPIRIFEIGVQQGLSMKLWEQFFPHAIVVGLDGDAKPAEFPESKRFHFVQAWQDDALAMKRALDLAGGPFDIIIDDASHLGCHTARSFALLFPDGLKKGGIYVMEDICTSFNYETDYDAVQLVPAEMGIPGMPKIFPSAQHGMVGVVKQLMDHAMSPTVFGGYTRYPIEKMTILTNIAFFHKAIF